MSKKSVLVGSDDAIVIQRNQANNEQKNESQNRDLDFRYNYIEKSVRQVCKKIRLRLP